MDAKTSTPSRSGRWLKGVAAVAVCVGACWAAQWASRGQPPGAPAWYSIVPPLLAVTLALWTSRVFVSLGAAVVVGGMLSAWEDSGASLSSVPAGLGRSARLVSEAVWPADGDPAHLEILLFVVLIMAMVSVMLVGGGLQGIANWLTKYARSPRSTQLVAILLGMVVFIDDLANTMIVGPTMVPVSDRQRISREKLAFIVDATAAPVSGIAIISTWIGYEVGLLGQTAASLGLAKDGYAMFFDAIGFRFYCLGMIAFMFLNALTGQDFGPMAKAERRARTLGKPLADDARPLTSRALAAAQPHGRARVRASVGLLPMVGLLLFFVAGLWYSGGGAAALRDDPLALLRFSAWRETLQAGNSTRLLVYASLAALGLAVLLTLAVARVPFGAVARAILLGLRSSLLPLAILMLAWSLKGACDSLRIGPFLTGILAGSLEPALYPALVFFVACLISFATGTSWGTMAILIPTAVPVAFQLDGSSYGQITIVTIAAVLDGAIFGDHCSPISDTTILSSAASSCDHLAHVRTQMPYSVFVGGLALLVGYVPAGLGAPCWVGSLGGAAVTALFLLGLWMLRRHSGATASRLWRPAIAELVRRDNRNEASDASPP